MSSNNLSYAEIALMNTTKISINEIKNKPPPRPWDFGEITLLMLLIFGSVGNILTILVMRGKRMRNTNAVLFITCMAVSDILLLLLKFTANMIKIYRVPIYDLCILIQVIPQAATFISVWLIIITSAERAAAVLVPLKVAFIFSRARCKLIIGMMILAFLVLSSSLSICINHSPNQPYYCQIRGNKNGKCFYYYTYVFPWIKSAFGSWLPSLLGISLNLVIIFELYKASNARKIISSSYRSSLRTNKEARKNSVKSNFTNKSLRGSIITHRKGSNLSPNTLNEKNFFRQDTLDMTDEHSPKEKNRKPSELSEFSLRNKKRSLSPLKNDFYTNTQSNLVAQIYHPKEKQITIMLLTISLSFILLTLPYSAFELLRKLNVDYKWLKNRNVMRAFMLLIDINHATNFILYCLTAKRFRNELKTIVCTKFYLKDHDQKLPSKRRSNSMYRKCKYNANDEYYDDENNQQVTKYTSLSKNKKSDTNI